MTKLLIDLDCKLTGPYQQHSVTLECTFGSNADKNSAFHVHHSLLVPPMLCHFPVKNGKIFPDFRFPIYATITWEVFFFSLLECNYINILK